ncbi:purine-nucleoside phosphorylase [Shuttleworthella satelles]|uniref:Purine nucleoside phosphorylase n=1 Tax=Shuttleworthella satelles DSM 14600 TaxID=626523 RepID=C4G988_9FIRM|nr:purine-nucleoside phosphorylase [Shuttleworthia satelles]EEP29185.1 purine nucleoside phosphorylase I, inosine and guanosine-specific [Shuttleworthia satelles DSM 14600]
MDSTFEQVLRAYESIRDRIPFTPRVALVLGSGLGDFADSMQLEGLIPYQEIAGFPQSTAPGHVGRYVIGYVAGTPTVVMQGRIHYYEGYEMEEVVMPIRLMKLMGAKILFLTNASGGIRRGLAAGDLMLIRDQISFLLPSPLRGANISQLGIRFPDMSHIYDPDLSDLIRDTAGEEGIHLKEGVYLQTRGPQYESPAEIRAASAMGADAVGMSTACEAVAARHMGMRVVGVSCISNLAAGISPKPLSEEEVIEAGRIVAEKFTRLVKGSIGKMSKGKREAR